MRVLVTGGYGFIGSHFVKLMHKLGHEMAVLDGRTYAAINEKEVASLESIERYHVDIRNEQNVKSAIEEFRPHYIAHFAAESHVCRSIAGPKVFFETNVMGTYNLINAARSEVVRPNLKCFLHVSTDEVFGELPLDDKREKFHSSTGYDPRSPYAASKAASDHLVRSFATTYDMPVKVVNCTNNYGPGQHLEKLIPKTLYSAFKNEPVEIYGDGKQVRDWIHVSDCVNAIRLVMLSGEFNKRYLIGGNCEKSVEEVVTEIGLALLAEKGVSIRTVKVNKRATDDRRYAVTLRAIRGLGWEPRYNFSQGLREQVNHYFNLFENQLQEVAL